MPPRPKEGAFCNNEECVRRRMCRGWAPECSESPGEVGHRPPFPVGIRCRQGCRELLVCISCGHEWWLHSSTNKENLDEAAKPREPDANDEDDNKRTRLIRQQQSTSAPGERPLNTLAKTNTGPGTSSVTSVVVAVVWLYTVLTWPVYWLAAFFSSSGRNPGGWKARVVSSLPKEVTFRALASDERCSVVEELREAEVTTMANFFSHVVLKFGSRRALGTRTLIKEYEQKCSTTDKMLSKVSQGDYRWITYGEVNAHSDAFGRGLRELCGVKPRDKVCIIAETKAEGLISVVGCYKNAIGLVTVYANLGEEGLVHGIVQTEATTIIVSHELLDKMLGIIKDGHLPNVRHVVYFEHQLRGSSEKSQVETIELLSFSRVIARVQLMLSGGAPRSEDTHEFIRACFSLKLLQGYDLTETCATACITDTDDMTTGIVGPPLPGVDVRIVDWEEGSYTVKDSAESRVGSVNIIDRKKNLVKL